MAAKRETTAEAFEREIRFEEITVPVTALIASYIRKKTPERSIDGIAKPFPTQLSRVGARCLRCDAVFQDFTRSIKHLIWVDPPWFLIKRYDSCFPL